MRSFAALALAGAVAAMPSPQGVYSAIAPQEEIPSQCRSTFDGSFMISVVNVTSTPAKRALQARQDKALTVTLKDGTLTDDTGRTGYIAANNQFQFDAPVQTGAIYTSGFSVCENGTLALGNSAIFYQCLSGTFYNLYDESTGAQCSQIYIDVIPAAGSSSATAVATQKPDGQITASPIVSQISDGQIQATTGTPAVITQISDGQIQATTGTAPVVSQISDGQIQAPTSTAAVVSQISDGQIQAPTTTPAVVSQISDGQIQAPTATGAVVSQISDGQIQAPTNGTTPTRAPVPSVSVFTGGATQMKAGAFGLAAAVLAMAML